MIGLDTGELDGGWQCNVRPRWSGPLRRIQESSNGGSPLPVRLVADLDLRGAPGRSGAILLDRHEHPLTHDLATHPQPVPMGERQA